MRKLFYFLAILAFTGTVSMSFVSKGLAPAYQKGNTDGHENIDDNLFIPADFFIKYNLAMGSRPNQHIKDWSTIERTAKFADVTDVRWVFDNAAQAAEYHAKNLKTNSDGGLEIQTKVNIPGITNLHIYRESKSITDLNKEMGIDTKEFYYLFTIDNVVAKVFVTVNGDISVDDASIFAKEAAKAVKKALGK